MEEALGGTVEKRGMARTEGIVAACEPEREDGRIGTELRGGGDRLRLGGCVLLLAAGTRRWLLSSYCMGGGADLTS